MATYSPALPMPGDMLAGSDSEIEFEVAEVDA